MKKKIECLLILFIFAVCTGFVQAVNVVNYEFDYEESGALVPPDEWRDDNTPFGWTWNGTESRGIGQEGTNHYYWQGSGSYLSQLTDQAITAEGMSFTLQVNVRDDYQSIPRIMLYYDDGGVWYELGIAVGSGADDTWETVELTVTTTAASVGHNLGIALSQADDTGWSHFDNVRLTNNVVLLELPPNGGPDPVSTTPTLQWSVAPTVEKIDLYLGKENDPNLTEDPLGLGYKKLSDEPATTTSYTPGSPLEFEKAYFWKVVAYEPNTLPGGTGYIINASDVWSFTTTGPAPDILAMTPYGQSVPAGIGEDPTITVSGNNLDISVLVWSKGGVELTDPVKYGGLGTETLTINDMVFPDDEGIYSCYASNAEGDDTATAVVVAERLMSWWKLDGNLDDSVQDVEGSSAPQFNGVLDPNTVFTTDDNGIDGGNSVIFDIDDPNCPFIVIDGTEEWFNFYEDELTVNAWIRTSYVSSSAWPAVVSKQQVEGAGYVLALDSESETLTEIYGTRVYSEGPVVADSQWHMLTLTYDGSVQRVYVDGVLEATSGATTADAMDNIGPVTFGNWDLESLDADFDGNIDNVKIYSYALTSTEVGEEYVLTNPNVDYVCNNELPSFGDYDDNENCKIDLPDFAAFADLWLDCNRIPESACSLP